jgi:hypothetical protein
MFRWRLLVEDGREDGHTFSQPDLIIAATALHHGLTVVTRGMSDYQKARAPVLDPWAIRRRALREHCAVSFCAINPHVKLTTRESVHQGPGSAIPRCCVCNRSKSSRAGGEPQRPL